MDALPACQEYGWGSRLTISSILLEYGASVVDHALTKGEDIPSIMVAKEGFLRKLRDLSLITMVLVDRDHMAIRPKI